MAEAYTQAFAEWMASPPQSGRLVEGVAIFGNSFIGVRRYATGIYEPATLPDEWGNEHTWAPANIELEDPERRASLEQDLRITFSGLRADAIRALDRMPPEHMASLTTLRIYSWLVPSAMAAPQVIPPPRFAVEEVIMSGSAIEVRCSGPLLPNWRAGRVYTIEEFPGLSTE